MTIKNAMNCKHTIKMCLVLLNDLQHEYYEHSIPRKGNIVPDSLTFFRNGYVLTTNMDFHFQMN